MGFIFSMSAEPAEVSSKTSGGTIELIFKIIYPGFNDMSDSEQAVIIEENQHLVRKLAHFSIYAILGMLSSVASVNTFKNKPLKVIVPPFVGIFYAISDELHQTLVPGRSGQISDVLLDSVGVVVGCSLIMLTVIVFKRRKIKK